MLRVEYVVGYLESFFRFRWRDEGIGALSNERPRSISEGSSSRRDASGDDDSPCLTPILLGWPRGFGRYLGSFQYQERHPRRPSINPPVGSFQKTTTVDHSPSGPAKCSSNRAVPSKPLKTRDLPCSSRIKQSIACGLQ